MPNDPAEPMLGLLSACALGAGFGCLVSVFCPLHHFFHVFYVLVPFLFQTTSGPAIDPEPMTEQIGDYLSWNPFRRMTSPSRPRRAG